MNDDFPFRLYGQGLLHGARIDYRVHFDAGVDVESAAFALEEMPAFAGAPEEYALLVSVEGQFVSFGFANDPEEAHGFEPDFLAHLRDVHAEFPIVEVLALSPGVEWTSGDWERASAAQQAQPDEGPTFGARPWWRAGT